MKQNARYDTGPVAGDISASIHHFVKRSSGNIVVCSATTDIACGVLDNKPTSTSHTAEFVTEGEVTVIAGAAVTAGVKIQPNGSGRAITLASGGHCAGIAKTGALADGDPIQVVLAIGGGPAAP